MKPPEPKAKRPEAAATAIEASGKSHTVNLADHSDGTNTTFAPRDNTKRMKGAKKAKTPKPETVLAEAPVPRGFARISVVQDKRGPVIHARRWYEAEDGPRGTREGFTVDRADHARTLADGFLKAADLLDGKPVS